MQQNLPSVEGLTPVILWYTFAGLVGIGALLILADKVAEIFRRRSLRRQEARDHADGALQAQHARLIIRLDDIEAAIRENDRTIDRNDLRITTLESNVAHIDRGIYALARAELAHIQHDLTGNHTDSLGRAEKEITDYLTRKGEEHHV